MTVDTSVLDNLKLLLFASRTQKCINHINRCLLYECALILRDSYERKFEELRLDCLPEKREVVPKNEGLGKDKKSDGIPLGRQN